MRHSSPCCPRTQSTWLLLRAGARTEHAFTGTAWTRDTLVTVHRHQWAAVNPWTVEVPRSSARLHPGRQDVRLPRATLGTVTGHAHSTRTQSPLWPPVLCDHRLQRASTGACPAEGPSRQAQAGVSASSPRDPRPTFSSRVGRDPRLSPRTLPVLAPHSKGGAGNFSGCPAGPTPTNASAREVSPLQQGLPASRPGRKCPVDATSPACGLTPPTPGPPPAPRCTPPEPARPSTCGRSLLVPPTVGSGPAQPPRAPLSLTGEGGGPQGYFDGRQRQEVAGVLVGGGRAPASLGFHGDHGGSGGGGGSDGDGGAGPDGLKAVVATTCRRGTRGSAWGHAGPREAMPPHRATRELRGQAGTRSEPPSGAHGPCAALRSKWCVFPASGMHGARAPWGGQRVPAPTATRSLKRHGPGLQGSCALRSQDDGRVCGCRGQGLRGPGTRQ